MKYSKVEDIMNDFYDVRLHYYELRKEYLLSKIERDNDILSNKLMFIEGIVNGKL